MPVDTVTIPLAERSVFPHPRVKQNGVQVTVGKKRPVGLARDRREQIRFRRVNEETLVVDPEYRELIGEPLHERLRVTGRILRVECKKIEC